VWKVLCYCKKTERYRFALWGNNTFLESKPSSIIRNLNFEHDDNFKFYIKVLTGEHNNKNDFDHTDVISGTRFWFSCAKRWLLPSLKQYEVCPTQVFQILLTFCAAGGLQAGVEAEFAQG